MKSLRTYSARTLIFGSLVVGIVGFVFFVFVTVVFDLGERRYVVVRASDYVRMNRTDFAETSKAPHIDSVEPDFQKKIDDTTRVIDEIHKNYNHLEDIFDIYVHHIQDYTELQKNIHTQKEENKKNTIKENTTKIVQLKKQLPLLQKRIIAIKKSQEPLNDLIVTHQKKIDIYASQLAILAKQMQTNIIVSQVKRVKDQMSEARVQLSKAEEDSQKLIAESADLQTQIENINKNIPLLQGQIDELARKNESEEDRKNISETKNLIAEITQFRDDMDTLR